MKFFLTTMADAHLLFDQKEQSLNNQNLTNSLFGQLGNIVVIEEPLDDQGLMNYQSQGNLTTQEKKLYKNNLPSTESTLRGQLKENKNRLSL